MRPNGDSADHLLTTATSSTPFQLIDLPSVSTSVIPTSSSSSYSCPLITADTNTDLTPTPTILPTALSTATTSSRRIFIASEYDPFVAEMRETPSPLSSMMIALSTSTTTVCSPPPPPSAIMGVGDRAGGCWSRGGNLVAAERGSCRETASSEEEDEEEEDDDEEDDDEDEEEDEKAIDWEGLKAYSAHITAFTELLWSKSRVTILHSTSIRADYEWKQLRIQRGAGAKILNEPGVVRV